MDLGRGMKEANHPVETRWMHCKERDKQHWHVGCESIGIFPGVRLPLLNQATLSPLKTAWHSEQIYKDWSSPSPQETP